MIMFIFCYSYILFYSFILSFMTLLGVQSSPSYSSVLSQQQPDNVGFFDAFDFDCDEDRHDLEV